MKGMELAAGFYEDFGRSMLERQFPQLLPYLAAGLIGSGSECFGYDDEISQDHDFEPGFCIFLPGEDLVDRKTEFQLERAYAKLPREYGGFQRPLMQPAGGARRGVLRTEQFLMDKTGTTDGILDTHLWLTIPEQSLAELTNGKLFFDGYGQMTGIREELSYFPADIWKKKLAGHLLLMAQSGQYNYQRCILHGERAAAQLAVIEFAKSAMEVIFLLNRVYQPYYKWSFRAIRSLPGLSLAAELMEYLITTDNDGEMADEKYSVIEGVASDVTEELMRQDLTKAVCMDLEKHAYSVNDGIEDAGIRNMHILAGT